MQKSLYVSPEADIMAYGVLYQMLEDSNTEPLIGGGDPDITW